MHEPSQHASAMELRLTSRSPSPSRTPSLFGLQALLLLIPLSPSGSALAIASLSSSFVLILLFLYTQVRKYWSRGQGESGQETPCMADLARFGEHVGFPIWSEDGEGDVKFLTGGNRSNGFVEVSR